MLPGGSPTVIFYTYTNIHCVNTNLNTLYNDQNKISKGLEVLLLILNIERYIS